MGELVDRQPPQTPPWEGGGSDIGLGVGCQRLQRRLGLRRFVRGGGRLDLI
ncbi:MAG: hypothetical protein UU63_C0021G0001, partial [Candidatus Uhrbacteria bacterium GW2011_GWF2_41_430]